MTTAPQTPVVALTQLHKQFDATIALDGIDLVIERPCIFGVVGPDGAGKTTLLRSLVGLLEFEAAQAHILGYDVVREPHRIRERLGYVPQAFGLYPELSVLHNLKFFADIHGITASTFQQRSEELLTIAGLEDFQARETGALSGGMKQKLAVICALIHRPQLLLFAVALVFMLATLAFGIFCSAWADNQQQAIFLSFFVMFPSVIITGILVPTENYPPFVSFLSHCLPARYFAHALRSIILKGVDFAAVAQDFIFLTSFFLVALWAAVKVTKPKLG